MFDDILGNSKYREELENTIEQSDNCSTCGSPEHSLSDCDQEQLRRYCDVCGRVTDWEDGFDINTGNFSEWCIEH